MVSVLHVFPNDSVVGAKVDDHVGTVQVHQNPVQAQHTQAGSAVCKGRRALCVASRCPAAVFLKKNRSRVKFTHVVTGTAGGIWHWEGVKETRDRVGVYCMIQSNRVGPGCTL